MIWLKTKSFEPDHLMKGLQSMTLDKSILTDIILILGIIITFITTYVKRRNVIFSLMCSAFYIGCYCLFLNYFLPFPLDFNPIFKFDQYFTLESLFLMSEWSNIIKLISDYMNIILIALFMGISSPMIFKNCRTLKGSLIILTIPIGMNLFFFIMDLIMGGLYQYVDICIIIFFESAFYIGYIPTNKFCSKFFDSVDRTKAKQKNFDGVI